MPPRGQHGNEPPGTQPVVRRAPRAPGRASSTHPPGAARRCYTQLADWPRECILAQSIEIPAELARFELPEGLQTRLQTPLDTQDAGTPLTPAERQEAAGLVAVAEFLSLLYIRARRLAAP